MTKRFYLPGYLLLALLLGCSHIAQRTEPVPTRAPSGGEGKWQTVWVDPQIVESGKTFTIIRSNRLDSVMVEKDVDYTPNNTPSLMFQIGTRACEARVELLDGHDKLLSVLITRRLESGHYKVSFDTRSMAPGIYSIRALFCGQSAKKTFAVTQ